MANEVGFYVKLGKTLAKLRHEKKLSGEDVAAKMGWRSVATLSHYENGMRKIPVWELTRLCRLYDANLSQLVKSCE